MYIEIQDATKIYEKPGGFRSSKESFTALDHISLQIEKGEFICLLGPSGCGKTTLMNSIAGFETLTEGSITIDGQKVKAPSEKYVTIFQIRIGNLKGSKTRAKADCYEIFAAGWFGEFCKTTSGTVVRRTAAESSNCQRSCS